MKGSTESKAELKNKLLEALSNNYDADPTDVQELLDTTSSSVEDNGDMMDPQGMAQAYLH